MSPLINHIGDGNSLTVGNGSADYLSLLWADTDIKPTISGKWNKGVGGQTTADMISLLSTSVSPYRSPAMWRNLVTGMEVRNDLFFGATVQQAYDNVVSYCNQVKAHGFDIIWINQPPSTGGSPVGRTQAELEIARQAVRAMILADYPLSTDYSLVYKSNTHTYAKFIIDVGGDSLMGDVATCANATYFSDGTHPTDAGYLAIKNIIKRGFQYYLTIQ